MKHTLFICDQCGARSTKAAEGAPHEWATIHYERYHTVIVDGEPQAARTTSTTFACGSCAEALLQKLEKHRVQTQEVDAAFDHGGVT